MNIHPILPIKSTPPEGALDLSITSALNRRMGDCLQAYSSIIHGHSGSAPDQPKIRSVLFQQLGVLVTFDKDCNLTVIRCNFQLSGSLYALLYSHTRTLHL